MLRSVEEYPVHLRKDRYNKKLKKYYVVIEENDTDVSEDEEVERHVGRSEVPWLPLPTQLQS